VELDVALALKRSNVDVEAGYVNRVLDDESVVDRSPLTTLLLVVTAASTIFEDNNKIIVNNLDIFI
jgi:hypothetical protein